MKRLTRHGRSFRLAERTDGPPRGVIGPGVLAAVFAVVLALAGAPARIGAVGPGGVTRSPPLLAHRSPTARSPVVAPPAVRPDCRGPHRQR